jgi:hypothetical protein
MKLTEVDFLRIVSTEGHQFVVGTNAISVVPGFVKAVEQAASANERVVEWQCGLPRTIMRILLDYVYYKVRYLRYPDYNLLPKFNINPNYALQVFTAAQDLGI